MKNKGIDAISLGCGVALKAHPVVGAICEGICIVLKNFL